MTARRPLVMGPAGLPQQLQDGDTLAGAGGSASTDAGNLLTLGSDNGLYFGVTTASVDIDATTPAPAVETQFLWSTLLGCYMKWNGSSWQQASPATNNIVIEDTVGTGSDFWLTSAITKALRYTTAKGVKVTVQMAATTYMTSNSYNFSDQDFSSIVIKGSSPVTATLLSCDAPVLVSGTTYNVTFALSTTVDMHAGMYVGLFLSNGSNGYWANFNGLWPITAVDSINNKITCTVTVNSGAAIVANASLTGSAVCFTTLLTTQYGMSFTNCSVNKLQDVCLVQSGSPAAGTVGLRISESKVSFANVGVYGFSTAGAIGLVGEGGSLVITTGLYLARCTSGAWMLDDSVLVGLGNVVASSCGAAGATNGVGLDAQAGGSLLLPSTTASINVATGIYVNTGGRVRITGNVGYQVGGTTTGITAQNSGTVEGIGYLANVGTCSPARNTAGNNGALIYA